MPRTHEVTSIDDASSFAQVYRPTYRTFLSIGAFVKAALQANPYETFLSINLATVDLQTEYQVRKHTPAALAGIRAQLSTDYTANTISQLSAASGNTATRQWTALGQTNSVILPDTYTIDGIIDALIDQDIQANMSGAGITVAVNVINMWLRKRTSGAMKAR